LKLTQSVYDSRKHDDINPEIMQHVNLQWHLSNDTIKKISRVSKIREAQEGKQASDIA
jgi:hypothetical protein